MKRLLIPLSLILFLLTPTSLAVAQFANSDLAGTVTDQQGGALPGVVVTARNEATNLTRSAVTANTGTYAINGLKPGKYTLVFELSGFRTVELAGVELRVGEKARFSAKMELGAIEESLTVTGEAPVVEVTSKEIGGTLTTQEFETLPSQNRSALLFAALLPGVVPEPSTESTASDALFINGQDDNNNSFNTDGANNDDDVIGARAGSQARTPIEAIQEFQVLTTQFDAEFGRALGGVLNAVTKSGGNQFAGSVFTYFQDSGLNEPNFFVEERDLEEPDTQYRTSGFTLGGPLVKNRAFFFVSYEDNLNEEGIVGSFVGRPDLNFTTTENNDIENYLFKVDYRPVQNHHLAARYLLEESPQFNQVIGAVTSEGIREEDDTDTNWSLTWDAVLSGAAFNTVRGSFTKEDVAFAHPGFNGNGQNFPAQRGLTPRETHPGFIGGASDVAQARVNRSTQLDDTFSYFLPELKGEHEFRAGFQWSEREETFADFGLSNGDFFNFLGDRPFNPNDISTYPGSFRIRLLGGQTAPIPNNETLGVFVQDDWRISERVTLNLGVRWDEEDITDDSNNFAPRVGFAWDPLGKGKTVVRGGFGRFYDRFQLGFYQNFFLDALSLPQGFLTTIPDVVGGDRQFFFDIVQANGITNLTQLRDFLARMLEGGARPPINLDPTVDHPGRRQSYADTISLGAEHEVYRGISAAVDLIHTENRDELLLVDLNPISRAQGNTRPNISIANGQPIALRSISTFVNAGEHDYDALQLSATKRSGARWTGRVAYTYAQSEGNNEGGAAGTATAFFQRRTQTGYDFDRGVITGAPLDLGLDDPRSRDVPVQYLREHNFVLSGTYRVPGTSWRDNGGFNVAGIYRYLSGQPITLFTNNNFLDNGNREPLPGGTYDADTGTSVSQNGVDFNGRLRGADNPSFDRLDLSLRYDLPFTSRYVLKIQADIFNLFDSVNYQDLGGNRDNTAAFLNPAVALNPREFQVGFKFEF
jgi:hypothetical protein